MKCKNCEQMVLEGHELCSSCESKNINNMSTAVSSNQVINNQVKAEVSNQNVNLEKKSEISSQQNSKVDEKNKKKNPKGCCGCLVVFLIVILVIFGIVKGVKWYKNYSYEKFLKETLLVGESFDIELTEEEKKEDWNNDGITNEEAQKLGLNIMVSDSDEDGISDYDEINVYKSDPLKFSTMGDIYSDGYKVANDMDVLKKYETFKLVESGASNLKLEIDSAYDNLFVYKDYTGAVPSGYYMGVQPFRLFSFSGKVNLEVDEPKNYEVLTFDMISYETKKIKSKIENNNLVFEVNNNDPIMVVYKKSILRKMDQNALSNIESKFQNNRKKEFYVLSLPLITWIFNHPVYVLEVDNSIKKGGSDIEFQDKFNERTSGKVIIEHYFTNSWGINIISSMVGELKTTVYNQIGEENKVFLDYIIRFRKVGSEDELYQYLIGEYAPSDEDEDEDDEVIEEPIYDITDPYSEKYNNKNCEYCADSGFNVGVNAFNFQNLTTEVSNGVCAGIAHITTNIYNGGNKVKKEVSSVFNMKSSDYDTIWNGNLYNYQVSDSGLKTYADLERSNEVKLNSSSMSKPDSEVVKSLEYYWGVYNDEVKFQKLGWAWNINDDKESYISESTIKKLVKKFNKGEIVTVHFLQTDSEHAINAYKIVEDKNNPDILYIKAYDNNFPNDMFWSQNTKGKVKYDVTIVLKREYEKTLLGEKSKYSYSYNPINYDDFNYGTHKTTLDGILFIDENYNAL